MSLIRSKKRVADHGEVFTPAWMVDAMLDLVKGEAERIDARFLEPACGSGNFLVPVLQRKLAAVQLKFGKSDFNRRHYALLGLMCCYGIELLADNIDECRANMLEILSEYLGLSPTDDLYRAASHVLAANLVHGDALTMKTTQGAPITFAEWGYIGKAIARNAILHTLGNLTLLTGGLNISSGNKGFDEKKAKFAEHTGLFLNKWFTGKTQWTEDEIRERGERFADVAVSRWIGLDGS